MEILELRSRTIENENSVRVLNSKFKVTEESINLKIY